jgi:YbgC/YbaW family acyl-CoA thioester hydrolase
MSRRVQWIDTDAAGIWHYSTIIRWAEEAESELHRRLGIVDQTFGVTPRVKVEFEFAKAVRFEDVVDITIEVVRVGRSSLEYAVDAHSDGDVVASGKIVIVLTEAATGRTRSWPAELRAVLE